VPDIIRTTKIVKCDAEKTNLINYSLLYLENNTDSRQYGCKAVEMLDWALTLRSKEKKHFSQNGEDGVLDEILTKIGVKSQFFVEFGVEGGTICNTRYFREKGWKGVMFDYNNNNPAIGLHRAAVWIDNVVQLFQNHSVPESFDLLSVDTDFNDFWNLREIMRAGYKPRVVIVEVNVSPGPYSSFSIPKKEAENHGLFGMVRWFGASVLAYAKLMHKFGYQLLHVESTVTNAIFVKSSEINNIDLARTFWQRKQFEGLDARAQHPPDPQNRPFVHILKICHVILLMIGEI